MSYDDVIKGSIENALSFDANNNLNVNLNTALSKDLDSVDVGKMSDALIGTVLNDRTSTTTSAEFSKSGYKHLRLECIVSGTGSWAVEVLGACVSGNTHGSIYKVKDDGTLAAIQSVALAADGTYILLYKDIPPYFEVKATRTAGNITVIARGFN